MTSYQPGSYFVVRTTGWAAWVIRLGTRSWCNHAGVIIDSDGNTVEAKPQGARRGNVSDYADDRLQIIDLLDATDPRRARIAAIAVELIGTPYGWPDIVSLAMLQYGIKLKVFRDRVARSDRLICSQLTDRAFQLGGVHLFKDGRLDMDVTPADLSRLQLSSL